MSVKEIEAKIYDTFYDNGGDDARTNGLWKAVIDAKKSDDAENALHEVLAAVMEGWY